MSMLHAADTPPGWATAVAGTTVVSDAAATAPAMNVKRMTSPEDRKMQVSLAGVPARGSVGDPMSFD
jgi:hypothetical protein